MTKEEYVELVKEIRAFLASGEDAGCPCPKTKCEWHGKCYECVRMHRHFKDHVPNCLQPMLREQARALARVAEMTVEPKPMTPGEYWDYVNEVAPPEGKKKTPAGEEEP